VLFTPWMPSSIRLASLLKAIRTATKALRSHPRGFEEEYAGRVLRWLYVRPARAGWSFRVPIVVRTLYFLLLLSTPILEKMIGHLSSRGRILKAPFRSAAAPNLQI
jgi:hypothetical protein